MWIDRTDTRVSLEAALQLCKTENNGLLGKAADWLRGGAPMLEILSVRQFYYPYYCAQQLLCLPKSRRSPDSIMQANMAVDGVFGIVQAMECIPETKKMDLPSSKVAKANFSCEDAAERMREFINRFIYHKYHTYPSLAQTEMELVYKPLYAMECRKRGKKYYQIIDGEMGSKDYILDIRYPEIKFCSDDSESDLQ